MDNKAIIKAFGSKHKLVLGSQSPRRLQLLQDSGFDTQDPRCFQLLVSDIDEPELHSIEDCIDLAKAKAMAVKELAVAEKSELRRVILAADTIVMLKNKILGKPRSEEEACSTLARLSGKSHQVVTAFCLLALDPEQTITDYALTKIKFRELSQEEILAYVRDYKPMDKAGSYGIQEIGDTFVSEIDGDFDNVVGLPCTKVIERIQDIMKQQ